MRFGSLAPLVHFGRDLVACLNVTLSERGQYLSNGFVVLYLSDLNATKILTGAIDFQVVPFAESVIFPDGDDHGLVVANRKYFTLQVGRWNIVRISNASR